MGNTLRNWSNPRNGPTQPDSPLVSVICTCYNHAKYIEEALDSVLKQRHENIEILIIDNGSRDTSPEIIQNWISKNHIEKNCRTFFHPETINYCKSFNQGLKFVRGKYTIDLSADDVLLSQHIATAVKALESGGAGVYFSNAYLEGKEYQVGHAFYPIDGDGHIKQDIASGDIYSQVVQMNYLCAPTLVFRTDLLRMEGGYDERLTYEDFDIIVRMARKYPFVFHENIGVKKRILKSSFSAKQYRIKGSIMLPSTLEVCRKIRAMNKTLEENHALQKRLIYEAKHALASANFDVAAQLLALARETGISGLRYRLFVFWEWGRFDFSFFYRMYFNS